MGGDGWLAHDSLWASSNDRPILYDGNAPQGCLASYSRHLGRWITLLESSGRVRQNWEKEFTLWAGRIREYPGSGFMIFPVITNRFQRHGPLTLGALLAEVVGVASTL